MNFLEKLSQMSLGKQMDLVEQVEEWCKTVRAQVAAALHAGEPVEGWKLVAGKRGSRQWVDEGAAEDAMKKMRLSVDEMYTKKLISPTQAEKVLKGNPKRWTTIQALITQSEGVPHVAPESDERPALEVKKPEDDFDDETLNVEDLA